MRIVGLEVPELLIILAILVLIFGVGRLDRIGAELGRGIRSVRQAVSGEGEESDVSESIDR